METKTGKFDLCNVSKTNDGDLSVFLDQSGVWMFPLYGTFNRLIGPGSEEISRLLTLGKCQIPCYVPGLGGT